jgi:hypothetical protein
MLEPKKPKMEYFNYLNNDFETILVDEKRAAEKSSLFLQKRSKS